MSANPPFLTELQTYISTYFSLNTDHVKRMETLFKTKMLIRDSYYTEVDKFCPGLAFIKSGLVRMFKTDANGKEITQWISVPGSFITDLQSLVFDTPSRWNIQALTDCELYDLNRENYNSINQVIPHWDAIEKRFLAKCFVMLEDRVHGFLSLTAEERYQQLYAYDRKLFNTVPLQYIASMLGMTPETLSRIRRKSIS